jgi:DNA-binding IclR family transcriptional regulator
MISLLRLVAADRGATPLPDLAAEAGMPASTAHRLVAALVREGMLFRATRGRYLLGPSAYAMIDPQGMSKLLKLLGRPILDKLAKDTGQICHLGVFEAEMVTYLLKSSARRENVITREDSALEAYCTGVGKALLAYLPQEELDLYLSGGSFVQLTTTTITDPQLLMCELQTVRARGYAIDNCEMIANLRCIATPILNGDGRALAALSVSMDASACAAEAALVHLPKLLAAKEALQRALLPKNRTNSPAANVA